MTPTATAEMKAEVKAIYAAAEVYAVEIQQLPRDLSAIPDDGGQWLFLGLRRDPEREALSTALGPNASSSIVTICPSSRGRGPTRR